MAEFPKTLVNKSGSERVVAGRSDEAHWKFRGYVEKPKPAKPDATPRTHPTT